MAPMKWLAVALIVSGASAIAGDPHTPFEAGQPRRGWSFRAAGGIPVQSGGRIKPLDTYAREIVLFVTGKRKFRNWDSVDLIFSWLSAPDYWSKQEMIRVGHPDVRRQLLLEESRSLFSPSELLSNAAFLQYAEELSGPTTQAQPGKGNPREKELRSVVDRVGTFRGIVTGQAWPLVPSPMPEAWRSLTPGLQGEEVVEAIKRAFAGTVKAYYSGDRSGFENHSVSLREKVVAAAPGWNSGQNRKLSAELYYNRLDPLFWACLGYLLAGLLWTVILTRKSAPVTVHWAAALAVGGGTCFHVLGMALRCYVAGRPPVSNMYESVIWVSFVILVVAAVIAIQQKQRIVLAVASILASFGLFAANSNPAIMDPGIHPLVPVLRSNFWLTIHVLTITSGYAALALTLGIANVALAEFIRPLFNLGSTRPSRVERLNQLSYRAMQVGVVLLAAGTILGGVWADYSWGRFWGWDPKEVWALIALLCYVAILHARYAGWVGQRGFAAWTVLSFLSVLMAWYGVNFVLGVGLHSYGFSSGGGFWVGVFAMLQIAYVGVASLGPRKKFRA